MATRQGEEEAGRQISGVLQKQKKRQPDMHSMCMHEYYGEGGFHEWQTAGKIKCACRLIRPPFVLSGP